MKITFYDVQSWEKPLMRKKLKGHQLTFIKEKLSQENVHEAKDAEVVSGFIYSEFDKKVLNEMKKVRLIVTRSTGYDHIDLKECKKRNIVVSNVPFYGENTVAEHTFALILSLSRNVHKSYLRTTRNDFSIDGLMGFDLKDKTLGVIGAGHIGQHVIRIARGFGMNVMAFDINQDDFLAEVLGFEYTDIDTILKQSDIISLHVPLNKHTHHLINAKNIKKIKKGAVLINTSRGEVVETDALIEALDKKILSGVGLDVLEGEQYIREEQELLHHTKNKHVLEEIARGHILLSQENVVYTPHIAFYSKEALHRILETSIDDIISYCKGVAINTVL